MSKQRVIRQISTLVAVLAAATSAFAAGRDAPDLAGFYGGVALRDLGVENTAMTLGIPTSVWNRFAPGVNEGASRALFYGGYRWANDVAVEAAFTSSDKYALRPAAGGLPGRGIGLLPLTSPVPGDLAARSWNVDLYTSWNFLRSFALYGRLGYTQADVAPLGVSSALQTTDTRKLRDGMNYGVGLRYDMNSALGLRVEYGRFGRFAGEIGSTPLESDQVTFGVRYRF